jgi:hypothetical protein
MTQILKITQDTVFKRRPLQSKELGADEMVSMSKGMQFELQSYAYADTDGNDFDDHIKFAFKNQQDNIKGFNTWYVYELHANVLQDGIVVYPQTEKDPVQTLKILQDTVFKRRPLSSNQLAPNEMGAVKKGTIFDLDSYAYADANGKDFDSHVKFALSNPKQYINGLNTWYVYEQHIQVLLDGKLVYPKAVPIQLNTTPAPQPVKPAIASGPSISLPGYSSQFFLNQPIIPGGSFTWAEATRDGTRIPKTQKIVDNMMALAKALEQPRNQIGRPFIITSWYRPPEVNNSTFGAASNSQHLYGKAIDFYVDGMTPREIQQALEWWPGGMGTYSSWNHLDIGPWRRWEG